MRHTLNLLIVLSALASPLEHLRADSFEENTPQKLSVETLAQVDTSDALRWLANLEGDTSLFVSRLFSAHWIDHADINDPKFLEQLTDEFGLVRTQDTVDLASIELEAEAQGLFDAPTFFIEGHMFMGRAHIPLMRQLLTDTDCH